MESLSDRRLRSREPRELLSGRAAAIPIARAQAYLCIGAAATGTLAAVLPHPPYFNVAGLLAVQAVALILGLIALFTAGRAPSWIHRTGPALATVMTTVAVVLSGSSTSGYVMLYLWVGLYAFYFPTSRAEAAFDGAFALLNYAVAIAITPSPEGGFNADVNHFVIATGTLLTAGVLLTYLRSHVERLMGRLTDASRTDALTGLPNRVALHQVLESELERAEIASRPLSLLVIDIDGFKAINERHGIEVGDQVLQTFGSLVEESTRLIDTVTRSGGEEFAAVLPEAEQHRAFMLAEKVLADVRERFKKPSVEIRASAGVASFPDHGGGREELLKAADEALHAAKALGGDRPVIYSAEVTSTLSAAASHRNVERQAHLATVLSLAEALDQRDSSTARHSQTVARLCEMMARELGFTEERVQRVRLAGLLHDIGKIGVSDSILFKPGPLTADEREQMRRHPELGARILSSSELDDVREWIVAHHERPDGTGYPRGLKGDQISVEASILAVADAYEAMTTDRVYRPSLGPDAAQAELEQNAGTQFSDKVVAALLRAMKREGSPVTR